MNRWLLLLALVVSGGVATAQTEATAVIDKLTEVRKVEGYAERQAVPCEGATPLEFFKNCVYDPEDPNKGFLDGGTTRRGVSSSWWPFSRPSSSPWESYRGLESKVAPQSPVRLRFYFASAEEARSFFASLLSDPSYARQLGKRLYGEIGFSSQGFSPPIPSLIEVYIPESSTTEEVQGVCQTLRGFGGLTMPVILLATTKWARLYRYRSAGTPRQNIFAVRAEPYNMKASPSTFQGGELPAWNLHLFAVGTPGSSSWKGAVGEPAVSNIARSYWGLLDRWRDEVNCWHQEPSSRPSASLGEVTTGYQGATLTPENSEARGVPIAEVVT